MRRPAFQFYPADWRKDVELRSCSLPARGLWIDLLCIAHECEPYGHLTVNGKALTAAQIAGQVGITAAQCKALLDELIENGVARQNEQGVIYSKRMVEDEQAREVRAEIGRQNGAKGKEYGALGAEHGAKGGRPRKQEPPAEPGQKPPQNPHPSSSSSSSASAIDLNLSVEGAKRATRKPPPSFAVTTELRKWAAEKAPGVNLDDETEKFRDHTFKTAITDWPGAWRNWIRNCRPTPMRPALRAAAPAPEPEWRTAQRERMQQAAPYAIAKPRTTPQTAIQPEDDFDALPLLRPAS